MYDLVEWAAAQPWSDGNVGMLGISYFAMARLEAAVEQPPHLKAIFPLEATIDLYESAMHNGLMSSSFVTTFLAMIGMTSGHTNKLWRSRLLDGIGDLLRTPRIHQLPAAPARHCGDPVIHTALSTVTLCSSHLAIATARRGLVRGPSH